MKTHILSQCLMRVSVVEKQYWNLLNITNTQLDNYRSYVLYLDGLVVPQLLLTLSSL